MKAVINELFDILIYEDGTNIHSIDELSKFDNITIVSEDEILMDDGLSFYIKETTVEFAGQTINVIHVF